MESAKPNPSSKRIRPDDPDSDLDDLELYSIPIHSSWFLWDEIHGTERIALKEFFDGSSVSRTPKIYKEYRDFIINKYREDPSRRLTFTEVRKSLVGDVCLLHKVFRLLENWGLINFGVPSGSGSSDNAAVEAVGRAKVKVEEGAPNGIRVVAIPNSLKPISVPPSGDSGEVVDNGFRFPPLASYLDVFGEVMKRKESVCENCGEQCDSGHYEYTKGTSIICIKCFKDGKYGENKSIDDFKLKDCTVNSGNHGTVWTEAEMLLLLESVLKHGDDWELVAQNVQTKTKLDCITKLIELPFGDLILGSSDKKGNYNGNTNGAKQVQYSSPEFQASIKTKSQYLEETNESRQNGDAANQDPPPKRKRITSLSDTGSSLMKQVALISTMVGPHITAAAAEAAVTALCDESSCSKEEIFDVDMDDVITGLQFPTLNHGSERFLQVEESEMKKRPTQSESNEMPPMKNDIPLTLRIRTAIATAFGAGAAHAKLLADQEDREIEHLVATIIDTQLKKLQCKMKHFEDLELIMEKEYAEMEELKESIVEERIDVLQRAFNTGKSRWKDHTSIKSQSASAL